MNVANILFALSSTIILVGCGKTAGEVALCDKKDSLTARAAIGISDTVNTSTTRAQREQTIADLKELESVVRELDVRGIKCK